MQNTNEIYQGYSDPYPLVIHWSQYALLRDLHLAFLLSDDAIRRVLDVGAGTGYQTIELLKAGKEVTAIDISDDMLGKLREKADDDPDLHDAALYVHNMDGQVLDFPDGSFDAVTGMNAYYNFPDPVKGFRESYRVLKPGGIFLMSGPRENADVDFMVFMSAAPDLLREGVFGNGASVSPQTLQLIMDGNFEGPNVNHLMTMREANKKLVEIATFYDSESLCDLLINNIGFSRVLFKTDNPYNKQAYFVAVRK
ncbi:MAG: class I SAM-dependent methyltransferase [Deltaproteobacteria bacterium]|nr:class I SAM-dependent methyltransferase [Deltaproteobacteria bacterium]